MQVIKEDVGNLNALFKVIDKAVFKELDGDGVVGVYQNLVRGKKLLAKMQEELAKPTITPDVELPEADKVPNKKKNNKGKK